MAFCSARAIQSRQNHSQTQSERTRCPSCLPTRSSPHRPTDHSSLPPTHLRRHLHSTVLRSPPPPPPAAAAAAARSPAAAALEAIGARGANASVNLRPTRPPIRSNPRYPNHTIIYGIKPTVHSPVSVNYPPRSPRSPRADAPPADCVRTADSSFNRRSFQNSPLRASSAKPREMRAIPSIHGTPSIFPHPEFSLRITRH